MEESGRHLLTILCDAPPSNTARGIRLATTKTMLNFGGWSAGETHDNRLCSVLLSALHPETMLLADRGYDAPVVALHAALEQEKIPRERFVALQLGQVVEI